MGLSERHPTGMAVNFLFPDPWPGLLLPTIIVSFFFSVNRRSYPWIVVAKIINRLAAGPSSIRNPSLDNSLRSGLATSAAEGGASERSTMDQTRHRSLRQVRKYIRRG